MTDRYVDAHSGTHGSVSRQNCPAIVQMHGVACPALGQYPLSRARCGILMPLRRHGTFTPRDIPQYSHRERSRIFGAALRSTPPSGTAGGGAGEFPQSWPRRRPPTTSRPYALCCYRLPVVGNGIAIGVGRMSASGKVRRRCWRRGGLATTCQLSS